MKTLVSKNTHKTDADKIAYWHRHLQDTEGLPFSTEIYQQYEARFKKLLEEDPYALHREHPEFVLAGRIHWALMSLFEGQLWKESDRANWFRTGSLPPMLESVSGYPANLDHSIEKQLVLWSSADRAKDGKGLGVLGLYGGKAEECAVWSVLQMFKTHPFRYPEELNSFTEPRERTCSFFRASEISKAIENQDAPEDSFKCAVSRGILQDCRNHEVLMIAGVGELPMGISASHEFYDILDHRRMQRRPTVWTTQFSSTELKTRFTPKMAGLIIQNLSKCGAIIKLPE